MGVGVEVRTGYLRSHKSLKIQRTDIQEKGYGLLDSSLTNRRVRTSTMGSYTITWDLEVSGMVTRDRGCLLGIWNQSVVDLNQLMTTKIISKVCLKWR